MFSNSRKTLALRPQQFTRNIPEVILHALRRQDNFQLVIESKIELDLMQSNVTG